MKTNTNWSSPKTNIFSGMNSLRGALASGYKARLIRMHNEDCHNPIKIKKSKEELNFRNYKFSSGQGASINSVMSNTAYSDFEKELTLNYTNQFGTPEAVKKYYEDGIVSDDNFKGMGVSHLVHVDDFIRHQQLKGDTQRANMYIRQYRTNDYDTVVHFFDFYKKKRGATEYNIKKFKRKLWVVELLDEKAPAPKTPKLVNVLNVLMYPLKYIPTKSILQMPDYKVITYRVGSITNGYVVEFNVPKKFSFK